MANITEKNAKILDFDYQLQQQDEAFPTLQLLNNDGKLIDEETFQQADISDEDLIAIMQRMILSRQLDIRSTKLAKQGRFGFFAPTAGQEASQMASSYAFKDEDWLFQDIVIFQKSL